MVYSKEKMGKRIAALRRRDDLTQAQLAEKLGISEKHCGCVERGEASLSMQHTVQLCEIFDASLDYIVLGESGSKLQQLPQSFLTCVEEADTTEMALISRYVSLYGALRGASRPRRE